MDGTGRGRKDDNSLLPGIEGFSFCRGFSLFTFAALISRDQGVVAGNAEAGGGGAMEICQRKSSKPVAAADGC